MNKTFFRLSHLGILLILIIAFFSRIYLLTEVPHGFFCDESAIGYNAYRLLKTGRDEYGVRWPFFFRSFGDYRNPVPIYFEIPFVAFFGLSDFSVRLSAAVAGGFTVFLIYLIGKRARNYWAGFFSGLFLATSQWHLHMSRIGMEFIYFPLFVSLGLYFWLLREKKIFYIFSFLFFGIALYTYYPAWVIVPLLVLGIFVISIKEFWKNFRNRFWGLIIFGVCLLPLFWGVRSGKALARWDKVRNQPQSLSQRLNKFYKAYKAHFSYDFLVKKGDIDYPGHFITRHSVRATGQVYFFALPLIFLGAVLAIFKRERFGLIIFWLLLLYPLGSALADNGVFATRSIIGLIPFSIFFGFGTEWFISKFRFLKGLLGLGVVFVCLFSWGNFLKLYFYQYPLYSSDFWGWQYGPKEIVPYFLQRKSEFDQLFLEGQFNAPELFIPFFSRESCTNCYVGGLERLDFNQRQLFALAPSTVEESKKDPCLSFLEEKRIYYPNKQTAFIIVQPLNICR